MIKLIQNEFMKLHAKKSLYYLFGLMVIAEFIVGVYLGKGGSNEGSYLDIVNGALDPIMFIATVFGISLGRKVITEEFQSGTIKQLLIRPKKRITILLSKYVTVLLMMLIFAMISILVTVLMGLCVMNGGSTDLTLGVVVKMFAYTLPKAFFFATLAFFLANVLPTSILSLIIPLIFYFTSGLFQFALLNISKGIAKYFITFHLDLNVYDSNPLIGVGANYVLPEFTFASSLLIVLTYIVALLGASCLLFNKRDIL